MQPIMVPLSRRISNGTNENQSQSNQVAGMNTLKQQSSPMNSVQTQQRGPATNSIPDSNPQRINQASAMDDQQQ